MYPDLFGINGFSMTFMIIIGALIAIVLVMLYLRKTEYNKLDLLVVICGTLIAGIVFAILFENLYESIKHAINNEPQKWTWAMTFYGGLIGGVLSFLLIYKVYYLKNNKPILNKVLIIAPGAVALAHAFGRLGCFLSGCCYGLPTDEWYGIQFPSLSGKVIPTQLFEMIFLLVLSGVLLFLAFKYHSKYTPTIYLLGYSVFRFIIEFFRGDERGQLQGLSPSQYICIILFVLAFVLFYFNIKINKEGDN